MLKVRRLPPQSSPDKGQRSTVRLAARAAEGSLCRLQPADMQGQMIFWEGWFLSQYDADFRECHGVSFWHGELRCGWGGRAGGQVSRCLGAGSNACDAGVLAVQTTLIKQWSLDDPRPALSLGSPWRTCHAKQAEIKPVPDRGRSHVLVRSPARILRHGDGFGLVTV